MSDAPPPDGVNAERRARHQVRMAWMPWLYFQAKPAVAAWARPWQQRVREAFERVERVQLHAECFVAPTAQLFAEPHREIEVGPGASIAAECVIRGPVRLEAHVSINPRVVLDAGGAGIVVGRDSRIATGVHVFGWNHGTRPHDAIRGQPVTSKGVRIGSDVWVGAGAGICDGVTIGDGAVVGMHAVVTRDVAPGSKVAGNPARPIGHRG